VSSLHIVVFAFATVVTVAAGGECVYYMLSGVWDGALLAALCLLVGLNAGWFSLPRNET